MKKIGWIGTGVMGNAMCGHLLSNGYEVHVFNRTRARAENLVSAGAVWCDSPSAVARASDVVFTIVGYPEDVCAVILGADGVLAASAQGTTIVDMTTSEPELAVRIAGLAAEKGVHVLDAPVSGGDVGARDGTLSFMVGGEQSVFEDVLPLLKLMGSRFTLMGPAGAGQHTKMCNQTLIAGTMIGVVESLLYCQRAGLDTGRVIDVIGSGAASSWAINNLGRRIAKGDFEPGFFIKHFVKDMGIVLSEARRMNLSLPGLALVNQFYIAAMAAGLENAGTQALYRVLADMNGMKA